MRTTLQKQVGCFNHKVVTLVGQTGETVVMSFGVED